MIRHALYTPYVHVRAASSASSLHLCLACCLLPLPCLPSVNATDVTVVVPADTTVTGHMCMISLDHTYLPENIRFTRAERERDKRIEQTGRHRPEACALQQSRRASTLRRGHSYRRQILRQEPSHTSRPPPRVGERTGRGWWMQPLVLAGERQVCAD